MMLEEIGFELPVKVVEKAEEICGLGRREKIRGRWKRRRRRKCRATRIECKVKVVSRWCHCVEVNGRRMRMRMRSTLPPAMRGSRFPDKARVLGERCSSCPSARAARSPDRHRPTPTDLRRNGRQPGRHAVLNRAQAAPAISTASPEHKR
jgi:hypothetical protein